MPIRRLKLSLLSFMFIVLSTLSSQSWSADVQKLNNLFVSSFWTGLYQEGRCGTNTENLIRLALRQGIDLSGVYLVHLENKGGSNFGMVGAQQARSQGRFISANPPPGQPEREPGTANWYFHAFIYADGYIFDLDFTNTPQVVPFLTYLNQMFIPASKQNDKDYFRNFFAGYHLSFYPVKQLHPEEVMWARRSSDVLGEPSHTYVIPYLESQKAL